MGDCVRDQVPDRCDPLKLLEMTFDLGEAFLYGVVVGAVGSKKLEFEAWLNRNEGWMPRGEDGEDGQGREGM